MGILHKYVNSKEEYCKALAELSPYKLFRWAVFLCIMDMLTWIVGTILWVMWVRPGIEAEMVKFETEKYHKMKEDIAI